MKTKKIFSLLFVTIATMVGSYAQSNKTTMELLTATKWEIYPGRDNMRVFFQYSNSIIYADLYFDNISHTDDSVAEYYLSNTIVDKFESDKVGKIQNGKYIISRNSKSSLFGVSEIIKLNDKELIKKGINIHNLETIGGWNPVAYRAVVFGKPLY